MALTNEQFDRLVKEYSDKHLKAQQLSDAKKAKLAIMNPELAAAENKIAELTIKQVEASLMDDADAEARIEAEIEKAQAEYDSLLSTANAKDIDPVYECVDCEDTGFVFDEQGIRHKCHCFLAKELEILYDQSNIRSVLEVNNFDNLKMSHRSGAALEDLQKAVDTAKEFINTFDSDFQNLVFYGTVGTGKSYLSCCIAKELLESHHSVLYMSSQQLFDALATASFGSQSDKEARPALISDLYGCDLLILDDLGTEIANQFVAGQLFALINERGMRNNSTIISTNLSLAEIRDRYSERVLSRLSGYKFRKLSGDDVRGIFS